MAVPHLPPEIINIILSFALPSSTTPSSPLDIHFARTREQSHDKSLTSLVSSAGKSWLPFARNLLWHDVHVGSTMRAEKLIKALQLALPGNPQSKGYLVPLVQRLEVDIRERPLSRGSTQGGGAPAKRPKFEKAHQDGILPVQIAQLATLLPHLSTLCISISIPGGWLCESSIFDAFHRFTDRPELKNLEITSAGLGYRNALHTFLESPGLESIKLRGLQPDWTLLADERESNLAMLSQPTPQIPYPFTSTLRTLVLWECRLDPQEFIDLFSSLSHSSQPSLKQVVVHRLETREATLGRSAILFPTQTLISSLTPLVPILESFHLVLPLTSSELPYPLDTLSSLFTSSLKSLVLGGPSLLSLPLFLQNLTTNDTFRPTHLTLTQCTFSQPSNQPPHGLKASDLVSAFTENWTLSLELLDVEGMTDSTEEEDGEKYWDSRSLGNLRDTVERINRERREDRRKELVLRVDEELEEREREEREWEERRRVRSRGGRRGGRGRR